MFVVLKSDQNDFKEKSAHQISWYHVERKCYDLVEITQFSRRTLEEIKKEYKDAFEEVIVNNISKMNKVFDEPEIASKPVPVKESVINKYRCGDCMLGSETVGGVRRHISKMHEKGTVAVIDIATGLPFKEEEEEEEEENDDAPPAFQLADEKEKESENGFKCALCDMTTESLGGMRRHITRTHGKDACEAIPLTGESIETKAEETKQEEVEVKAEVTEVVEETTFVRPKPKKRDF
jgi:hypothetical protein